MGRGVARRAALRRAVRDADGFFGAGSYTTAQFTQQVVIVREALQEATRDRGDFPITKRVYLAIDDDADRAQEHAHATSRAFHGDAVARPDTGQSLLSPRVLGDRRRAR